MTDSLPPDAPDADDLEVPTSDVPPAALAPDPGPPSARALRAARAGVLLLVGAALFGLGWCASPSAPSDPHAEHATGDAEVEVWTCSMHPQVRQPEPGQCPICGMDLIPATEGEGEALPDDRVALSERAVALARVRTTAVRRLADDGSAVRLLGRVDYDETTLATVTTWVAGRVDRLLVATTGVRVRRGQTIAQVYSPEVYAAQQDLLVAQRQLDRLEGASALARTAAQANLDAARARLGLLGIPESEIDALAGAARPPRQIAIRSPFAGTIIERLATEGVTVPAGAPLYRLADLSRLWIQLDAYESDLAQLAVGQTVELSVDALPDESLEGRLAFIDPVIDPRRRTARVRVEVSNP